SSVASGARWAAEGTTSLPSAVPISSIMSPATRDATGCARGHRDFHAGRFAPYAPDGRYPENSPRADPRPERAELQRRSLAGFAEELAVAFGFADELLQAEGALAGAHEGGGLDEGEVDGVAVDGEALRAYRLAVQREEEAVEGLLVRGGDAEERDLAADG